MIEDGWNWTDSGDSIAPPAYIPPPTSSLSETEVDTRSFDYMFPDEYNDTMFSIESVFSDQIDQTMFSVEETYSPSTITSELPCTPYSEASVCDSPVSDSPLPHTGDWHPVPLPSSPPSYELSPST